MSRTTVTIVLFRSLLLPRFRLVTVTANAAFVRLIHSHSLEGGNVMTRQPTNVRAGRSSRTR